MKRMRTNPLRRYAAWRFYSRCAFAGAFGAVLALGMVVGAVTSAVTSCGRLFDATEAACVKGRLSAKQAMAVNERGWGRGPGYCSGRDYQDAYGVTREGESACDAREGDRVVSASCAQALRSFRWGD